MNYQEKVLEFQKTAGEDFTKGLTPLREALLKEEIAELEEAIKNDDRVEILDALCDIKYVNDGDANLLGVEQLNDEYVKNRYSLDFSISILKEDNLFEHKIVQKDIVIFNLVKLFNFTLENFKTALDRVHESNMSKFCNTREEAEETIIQYKENGVSVFAMKVIDKWVIFRESDNKVLKSKYYHTVDLTDLI